MFFKTRAIVLREVDYKDHDRILTLLSEDRGLLTVKARGVKSKSSKLKVACQLFAFSEFTIFENRGFHTVREAVPVELFAGLRVEMERYALASYISQTAEVLSQEDSPSQLPLLVLHALHALCGDGSEALIKAAYELRLCALAGFWPDVDGCCVCGKEDADRFDVMNGCLICSGCRAEAGGGISLPLSPGSRDALRYILESPVSSIFRFRLGAASEKELSDLAETYLLRRLERGFTTLDFYKSLKLS